MNSVKLVGPARYLVRPVGHLRIYTQRMTRPEDVTRLSTSCQKQYIRVRRVCH